MAPQAPSEFDWGALEDDIELTKVKDSKADRTKRAKIAKSVSDLNIMRECMK